ncbi:MAG: ECF transporter S component [Clostridiales bacterium]|nr:ECF transporter S component [Clostridiales bacterium]
MNEQEKNGQDTKTEAHAAKQTRRSTQIIAKITLSAMFLALALAVKLIGGFYIPIFGGNGMRVGFAGVFTFFPAILFGPVYGAMVSGLLDILGYVLKPDGAYLPLLTVMAAVGGALKGLIWRFVSAEAGTRARIRAAVAVCFALIGVFGAACHISLISDGVTKDIVASKEELPSRGQTESMSLSWPSQFVVSLAQYNNDTITLSKAEASGSVALPTTAVIDGKEYQITKLGAGAFENASEITELHIPASYSKMDDNALEGLENASIYCDSQKFADAAGVPVILPDSPDYRDAGETVRLTVSSDSMSADGFTVRTSDTWRKYLAGYVNFITIGLEIIALAGLAFTLADLLLARASKKRGDGKPSLLAYSLKVFITITVPGIIVTTVNTEILRRFLAAWNGRSFMILWIPRLIEEMLVCMVQAYVIAVLYGVFVKRIQGRIIDRK